MTVRGYRGFVVKPAILHKFEIRLFTHKANCLVYWEYHHGNCKGFYIKQPVICIYKSGQQQELKVKRLTCNRESVLHDNSCMNSLRFDLSVLSSSNILR